MKIYNEFMEREMTTDKYLDLVDAQIVPDSVPQTDPVSVSGLLALVDSQIPPKPEIIEVTERFLRKPEYTPGKNLLYFPLNAAD